MDCAAGKLNIESKKVRRMGTFWSIPMSMKKPQGLPLLIKAFHRDPSMSLDLETLFSSSTLENRQHLFFSYFKIPIAFEVLNWVP